MAAINVDPGSRHKGALLLIRQPFEEIFHEQFRYLKPACCRHHYRRNGARRKSTRRNFSAEGFGRFLAMTMIAAGVTGSIANRGGVTRSFVKVGGIYFLVLLAVWLLTSFGGRSV